MRAQIAALRAMTPLEWWKSIGNTVSETPVIPATAHGGITNGPQIRQVGEGGGARGHHPAFQVA